MRSTHTIEVKDGYHLTAKHLREVQREQRKVDGNARGLNNRFQGNTQAGQQSTKRLGAGFSGLSRSVLGVGSAMGVVFAGRALLNAGKKMNDLAANQEDVNVALTTFLGNSKDAKKAYDEMNQFSNETPFKPDVVIETGKAMLANGVALDSLIPKLKVLGDIAAGTQQPLNELNNIFLKARSLGIVNNEILNQLSERGIPILQTLAEMYGVSTQEVRKMSSQNKVTFEDLEKGFQKLTAEGGLFNNMMANMSETVNGRVSTMQGHFSDLGRELGTRILPVTAKFIHFMDGLVKKTTEYLKTPLKEEIKKEQREFGQLVIRLQMAKQGTQERLNIIRTLQAEYGGYLKNIDLETANNQMLRDRLKEVNSEFVRRIALAEHLEKSEQADKNIQAYDNFLEGLKLRMADEILDVNKMLEANKIQPVVLQNENAESFLDNARLAVTQLDSAIIVLNDRIHEVYDSEEYLDRPSVFDRQINEYQSQIKTILGSQKKLQAILRTFPEVEKRSNDQLAIRQEIQTRIQQIESQLEFNREETAQGEQQRQATTNLLLRNTIAYLQTLIAEKKKFRDTKLIENVHEEEFRTINDEIAELEERIKRLTAIGGRDIELLPKLNRAGFVDMLTIPKTLEGILHEIEVASQLAYKSLNEQALESSAVRERIGLRQLLIEKRMLEARIEALRFFNKDTLDLERELSALKLQIFEEELSQKEAREHAHVEQREAFIQKLEQVELASIERVFSVQTSNQQNLLDGLRKQQDVELAAVGDNEKAKRAIYARTTQDIEKQEREVAKAKRRTAIFERTASLFQVGLSTASGIMKAVEASPLTFGLPWSGFVAAQGVLNSTAILTEPLPAYRTGTSFLKGPGTETSDSILIRASLGEAIVPANKNKRFRYLTQPIIDDPGISEQKLANIALERVSLKTDFPNPKTASPAQQLDYDQLGKFMAKHLANELKNPDQAQAVQALARNVGRLAEKGVTKYGA